MADFDIVNVPALLNQIVTTYNAANEVVPDDGAYQRHGAETQYVLAEFFAAKKLYAAPVDVSRRPDLTIKFSALTDEGQAFARFAVDKWMRSTDRAGPKKPVGPEGLDRLWTKFAAK